MTYHVTGREWRVTAGGKLYGRDLRHLNVEHPHNVTILGLSGGLG